MITEAKIPDYPTVETSLKLLLGSIWEWLMNNPPWFIGIVVAIALLLWYFLHALPQKRDEHLLEQHMLDKLNREEDVKRTKQQYREKKEADEAAAKALKEEARTAQEKAGRDFEMRIMASIRQDKDLSSWIDEGRSHILHNITLPSGAQIDLLFLDTSGIYIIECKCWKGYVAGLEDWPVWLVISCDSTSSGAPAVLVSEDGPPLPTFVRPNPIKQNRYHEDELGKFLDDHLFKKIYQFKVLNVFDECSKLALVKLNPSSPANKRAEYTWTGNGSKMCKTIYRFNQNLIPDTRLAPKDVQSIYIALQPYAADAI